MNKPSPSPSIFRPSRLLRRFSILVLTSLTLLGCLPGKRSVYLADRGKTLESSATRTMAMPSIKPGDVLSIQIDQDQLTPTHAQPAGSDPISVRSIQHPYLYGYTVNDSGTVHLPVIGKLYLAGMNVQEAQSLIQSTAGSYYTDVTVKVYLMNFTVSVLGEVTRPGRFPVYADHISVLQAIAQAGDLSPYANREEVRILRERGGKQEVILLDLTDATFLASPNMYLQPNDVVMVTHLSRKRFAGREVQLGLQGLGVVASFLGVIVLLNR